MQSISLAVAVLIFALYVLSVCVGLTRRTPDVAPNQITREWHV